MTCLSSESADAASCSSGTLTTNLFPFTPLCSALKTTSDTSDPTSVGASSTLRSPASSRATLERVDDRRQALRLRGDVAEKGVALLLPEEHVPAQQGLREPVDRSQGCAELVRDGRDEIGLHLLDAPLSGHVAEREDAACNRPRRVAHDRLGQRQPSFVGTAPDRDQALSGQSFRAGGEVALDHVDRRPSQSRDRRDSRDLLG